MKFLLSLTLILAILNPNLSIIAINAVAQDPTNPGPPPTNSPTPDKELDEAKRNAQLAEEKRKKAEAETAEAEARRAKLETETKAFGDPSKVSVPSGGVQTDQVGFVEVKMLSLEAARSITQQLTSVLCRSINKRKEDGSGFDSVNMNALVIYNEAELDAVSLYRLVITQVGQFHSNFTDKEKRFTKLESATNPQTNSADPELDSAKKSLSKSVVTANNNLSMSVENSSSMAQPPPPVMEAAAIPGIATGIITSIAQLTNLFRTDTSFQNKNVLIPEDMIVSYIVDSFNSDNCSDRPVVYYPKLYPTKLFSDDSESELLNGVAQLADDKRTAADNVEKLVARIKLINQIAAAIEDRDALAETLELKEKTKSLLLKTDRRCRGVACRKITAEIAELKAEIDKTTAAINKATGNSPEGFVKKFKGWLKNLKSLQTATQFLVDSADQVVTKLETPNEGTNTTPLTQLLKAEHLSIILNDDSTFMLRISMSANGTTKIKKNMFVDAKVRHSAGANLVYQLFDHDGKVVLGNAMQYYFDYKSATDIRDQVAKGQPTPSNPQGAGNSTVASKRH